MEKKDKDMKKILLSLLLVVTLADSHCPHLRKQREQNLRLELRRRQKRLQALALIPRNGLVRTSLIQT